MSASAAARCDGRHTSSNPGGGDASRRSKPSEAIPVRGHALRIDLSDDFTEGRHNQYCALVTDINLRGTMNGWEVAKQAREVDPAFPFVYMTLAAADDWLLHGVPHSVLLIKPFAPAELVATVSQLLNAVSPSAQRGPNSVQLVLDV